MRACTSSPLSILNGAGSMVDCFIFYARSYKLAHTRSIIVYTRDRWGEDRIVGVANIEWSARIQHPYLGCGQVREEVATNFASIYSIHEDRASDG